MGIRFPYRQPVKDNEGEAKHFSKQNKAHRQLRYASPRFDAQCNPHQRSGNLTICSAIRRTSCLKRYRRMSVIGGEPDFPGNIAESTRMTQAV